MDKDLLDTVWLAGLIEGEGCMDVSLRTSRRPTLRVRIKMTDKDVIEAAAGLMSSSVYRVRDPRANSSDCWVTEATAQKAQNVMEAVLPFMGKRRSAKIRECLATPNLSHYPRKATS